jgi:hypothetical protein
VRAWGPLMLACYGLTESEILTGWAVADFHRYRDFAKDVWLLKGRLS